MDGLKELKNAYDEIKNTYGFYCKNVLLPDEDNECYRFIFEYQGFPVKVSFTYMLFESPYSEVDKVSFYSSEMDVEFHLACYYAIHNMIKAIHDNRDDMDTMKKFIDYLIGA